MNIVTQDYYINHSCGCCTDWGTNLFVDGKPIDQTFQDKAAAFEFVLKSLGYGVDELDGIYDRDYDEYDGVTDYDEQEPWEGVEEGVPDTNSV